MSSFATLDDVPIPIKESSSGPLQRCTSPRKIGLWATASRVLEPPSFFFSLP